MKEILSQLSVHNVWADKLLIDLLLTLPEEKLQQEVLSSFPGLFLTVQHMLDAESIWWQRVKLQEHVIPASVTFKGSFNDLCMLLRQHDVNWHQWISQGQEHMFTHVLQYSNTKGEQFKQPVFQVLLQVFSHNSYHRGQLVTILRQVGIQKIPNMDFISWSRKPRTAGLV